eukprot:jgi/Chlat1/3428/Chrsp23S03753
MSSKPKRVLNYGDAVLNDSDVELLKTDDWLNDAVIEFYFEYCRRERFQGLEEVLLVSPSVAYWVAHCPDEEDAKSTLEPLELTRRALIVLPVCNNPDVEAAEGGSHWSTLIYDREANVFEYYDSLGDANEPSARELADAVAPYLGASSPPLHRRQHTPQQINSVDCGVYVLAIADAACMHYQMMQNHRARQAQSQGGQASTPSASSTQSTGAQQEASSAPPPPLPEFIERLVTPASVSELRVSTHALIQRLSQSQPPPHDPLDDATTAAALEYENNTGSHSDL